VYCWSGFWTIKDCRQHPDFLFVFGDNDYEIGKGGQAIIRDEENSIGIPTKHAPNNYSSAFYSDDNLKENKLKILKAIQLIEQESNKYTTLIFPENGIGTGLAQLDVKAPRTFKFLVQEINKLICRVKK
jgi:hypothetical protein